VGSADRRAGHPNQAQREAALYIARGGPPTRKPPTRRLPALTIAEQVLIIILRQRFGPPRPELAERFGVVTGTIAKAQRQARPLPEQHGHQIKPAPAPIKTLAELTAYASAHGVELTPKAQYRPALSGGFLTSTGLDFTPFFQAGISRA
jgi:hypothetical protein